MFRLGDVTRSFRRDCRAHLEPCCSGSNQHHLQRSFSRLSPNSLPTPNEFFNTFNGSMVGTRWLAFYPAHKKSSRSPWFAGGTRRPRCLSKKKFNPNTVSGDHAPYCLMRFRRKSAALAKKEEIHLGETRLRMCFVSIDSAITAWRLSHAGEKDSVRPFFVYMFY